MTIAMYDGLGAYNVLEPENYLEEDEVLEGSIDVLTSDQLESMLTKAKASVLGRGIRNIYYHGDVQLDVMGINIPLEMNIFRTVFNYPKIYVDAIEERMDVEGFRLAGDLKASDALWEIWQRNNLDEESTMAHREALVQKRCYLIVGEDESGKAAITAHTAEGIYVEYDRVTRAVTLAFQAWDADGDNDSEAVSATVYTPNYNQDYSKKGGIWTAGERRDHNLGITPVVPMVNRAALGDYRGRSEMDCTVKWTDAAARVLTNLQIAAEFVAMPQRLLFGVEKGEVNMDGALNALQAYATNILGFANDKASATQFPGADLRNFSDVINTISKGVAAETGLPLSYFGIMAANPSSADAIVKEESRLIKKTERKNKIFGEAWEKAMRIALLIEGQVTDATRVETIWRDPATPTLASKVDAVTKLRAPGVDGKPLISDTMGREMIGMSEEMNKVEAQRLAGATIDALAEAYGLKKEVKTIA